MNRHEYITNELKDLQSGLPHATDNPQTVPPDYFEGLADTILAKAKASEGVQQELTELSPLLAGLSKSMPFSIPDNFFDIIASDALAVVQENDSDSFLLQSIGRELPYSVPQGYFETLPNKILAQVAKPQVKVVPLFARTWMRVAAAAVIAGVLTVTGLQLFNKPAQQVAETASSAPSNTAVATMDPSIRQEIKKASTKELEEFVNGGQIPAEQTGKANNNSRSTDLLKDVSASEMEHFLSSMPSFEDGIITD